MWMVAGEVRCSIYAAMITRPLSAHLHGLEPCFLPAKQIVSKDNTILQELNPRASTS